jgi:polyhydroxybutyrate depolymerase
MLSSLTLALLMMLPVQPPAPRIWTVDGMKREALVCAPSKKAAGKAPLVFDFHGHGGTAWKASRIHHIHESWPEAIVVYMQGLNTPSRLTDPEGKKPGWQEAPGGQKDRDLKFFDAVLASMKADYPVDEQRIYASGHSDGGGFTYLLWAQRGDTFAAFAPVGTAAGMYFKDVKPKPLFHAASERDLLVRFAMQKYTIDRVKKLDACDAKGEDWAPGCLLYKSRNGTPVVIYLYEEGHKYPAEAPPLIVKFLKEQAKR